MKVLLSEILALHRQERKHMERYIEYIATLGPEAANAKTRQARDELNEAADQFISERLDVAIERILKQGKL